MNKIELVIRTDITPTDWASDVPEMQNYIGWVARRLGCEVKDLRYIDVHPDFRDKDEEGWDLDSFFPKGTETEKHLLHRDGEVEGVCLGNFAIGEVWEIKALRRKFIADRNASPVGMITSVKEAEENNDGQG